VEARVSIYTAHIVRWRHILIVMFTAVVIFTGAAAIFLSLRWPFSKARTAQSLQNAVPATVKFTRFRSRVFPRPGCDAEGVTFTSRARPPDAPPLVSVEKMSIRARYVDLLTRPGYIARIVLEGLRVDIPEQNSTDRSRSNPANPTGKSSQGDSKESSGPEVGEIVANGSVLEIERSDGKSPLKFDIHNLTVNSVGRQSRMTYRVAMRNAEPPGEIRSTGSFGPWKSGDAGQTPLSGEYSFQRGDLSVFNGIRGKLSSEDKFQGVLSQIEVVGSVDVPDFELVRSTHIVHLQSQFHVLVDAMNGDIQLQNVKAAFLRTVVVARGEIAGATNHKGKTTSIDLTVNDGRIQDLLALFGNKPRPPMSGITSLQAHASIPAERQPFLKELSMQGGFTIHDGHFTKSDTQNRIADLSARASGKGANDRDNPKNKDNTRTKDDNGDGDAQDPANVVSEVQGHTVVRSGIANFNKLSFSVPGAHTDMKGTYDLITQGINFHGLLTTDASFSRTAGGVKSVLLKPFDFFFRKKPDGAEIPVHMTGTYSAPHFGIDIVAKQKGAKLNQSSR
jgi:hypothetical protein